ncbi:MAG: hypothetical protein IJ779_00470 [Ruminococcus sp.]|nr:hypothetical protein [Ruminococcus sp.]
MFGKSEEKSFDEKPKKKEKPKPRFILKNDEYVGLNHLTVIVDSETGVNYLITGDGSITELKGADGKTVIDPLPIQDKAIN